uniref:Uncharacterized protein n=1 Tax=Timema poppense TaxID=170557 RepID=A0A7R9HCB2_TIMPO|nr:unnamed protein product [Timema poppensis]
MISSVDLSSASCDIDPCCIDSKYPSTHTNPRFQPLCAVCNPPLFAYSCNLERATDVVPTNFEWSDNNIGSPMASLVLTDSSQLTSDSHHLGIYSSPMASLVLTDSSQLTSDRQHLGGRRDGYEKLLRVPPSRPSLTLSGVTTPTPIIWYTSSDPVRLSVEPSLYLKERRVGDGR